MMIQKSVAEEMQHAETCLRSAKVNLENDIPDAAFNRLYYAAFHATRALLVARDVVTKSHKGVYTMLNQRLVKEGPLAATDSQLYGQLMSLRATADYGSFSTLTGDEARAYLTQVEAFVARAKSLLDADA